MLVWLQQGGRQPAAAAEPRGPLRLEDGQDWAAWRARDRDQVCCWAQGSRCSAAVMHATHAVTRECDAWQDEQRPAFGQAAGEGGMQGEGPEAGEDDWQTVLGGPKKRSAVRSTKRARMAPPGRRRA